MRLLICPALLAFCSIAAAQSGPASAPASRPLPNAVRWSNVPNTDTVFQPRAYRSLDEWNRQKAWLTEQVRFAAGLIPEPARVPLNPQFAGRIERDECTIEKVYFESQAGILVTGNLYRPKAADGKRPAIACPHGHWRNGRIHHDAVGSIPARCITLARLGFVVFAYDMLCYNDSGKVLAFKHHAPELNTEANALWGIGPLPLQTWNSVRVLDFLQSLPDVDPARIGVTGASGGGTQTFILSAIDDRVTAAVPVNMISSTMQGGCDCENAPCLRIGTQNMEIGGLFAPKPLLMISASGDWTTKTPQVEFPFTRSIYELFGAADHVANVHINAQHNYNLASREAMYPWFVRWLMGREPSDPIKEGEIKLEHPEELLIFSDANPPPRTLTADEVGRRLRAAAQERFRAASAEDRHRMVRVAIRHAVGLDETAPPAIKTDARGQSGETVLTRDGRSVRTWLRHGQNRSANTLNILVHPAGGGPEALAYAKALRGSVMLVEAFGTGEAVPPADLEKPRGTSKFFTAFNRTDTAEAIYDIRTVLDATMQGKEWTAINLVGAGRMGPACLAARAMISREAAVERKLRVAADMNGFDAESDDAYLAQLNLPNIRRVGGLQAIAETAATGPLWLHDTKLSLDAKGVQISADKANAFAIASWLQNDAAGN